MALVGTYFLWWKDMSEDTPKQCEPQPQKVGRAQVACPSPNSAESIAESPNPSLHQNFVHMSCKEHREHTHPVSTASSKVWWLTPKRSKIDVPGAGLPQLLEIVNIRELSCQHLSPLEMPEGCSYWDFRMISGIHRSPNNLGRRTIENWGTGIIHFWLLTRKFQYPGFQTWKSTRATSGIKWWIKVNLLEN